MEINPAKYPIDTFKKNGKVFINCIIRKKPLELTPEEFVRQVVIQYLIKEENTSINLIAVEKSFHVNDRLKRFDIVVYAQDTSLDLLVECKKVGIPLDEKVLLQATNYNHHLKAKRILLTNGPENKLYITEQNKWK